MHMLRSLVYGPCASRLCFRQTYIVFGMRGHSNLQQHKHDCNRHLWRCSAHKNGWRHAKTHQYTPNRPRTPRLTYWERKAACTPSCLVSAPPGSHNLLPAFQLSTVRKALLRQVPTLIPTSNVNGRVASNVNDHSMYIIS